VDDRALATEGFDVVADVVCTERRAELTAEIERRLGDSPGDRDGFQSHLVQTLARSPAVRALVEPVLGSAAFAYRATLFDKTGTTNWLVAWHQDLVVPVAEPRNAAGFGPWSQKRGTWFVQPPASLLATLLAVRVDLDGSDETNGGLRVLPGTHRLGVLTPDRVAELNATRTPVSCRVPSGGALRMRPLLLHASSKALRPAHRRIVHFEFAASPLPDGLAFRWMH